MTTITPDGAFLDWTAVLANPVNNVCDGPEGALADRDNPALADLDLVQFAFTWDDNNLYIYARRMGSTPKTDYFVFYGDTDLDGFMEDGEPVVVVGYKGNNLKVAVNLGTYLAGDRTTQRDPLVDGTGFGDGYTLPGSVPLPVLQYQGDWCSPDGLAMEFAVPWSLLGVAPGTPVPFHIASMAKLPLLPPVPGDVSDNVGGCGGGAGTIQFAALAFSSDRAVPVNRGQSVAVAHTLANRGNGQDSFSLSATFAGSFSPSLEYWRDADGDRVLDAGDTPLPVRNGFPYVGTLSKDQVASLLFVYGVPLLGPANPSGTTLAATTAVSAFDTSVRAAVTDTLGILPGPALTTVSSAVTVSDPAGNPAPKAVPGSVLLRTVRVTNLGDGSLDPGSLWVDLSVPAGVALYVGNLRGPATTSGPVLFAQDPDPSGLSYTFTSLGDGGDDLYFSSTPAGAFTYTPVPDGQWYDGRVTRIRAGPRGTMSVSDGVTRPGFTLQFRVRIK